MDSIDYHVLIALAENHWSEFVMHCEGEEKAEQTMYQLLKLVGMK